MLKSVGRLQQADYIIISDVQAQFRIEGKFLSQYFAFLCFVKSYRGSHKICKKIGPS